jgi:hypothetical protein
MGYTEECLSLDYVLTRRARGNRFEDLSAQLTAGKTEKNWKVGTKGQKTNYGTVTSHDQ